MHIVNNLTHAFRCGPAPLYHRITGAEAPQPAFIELDPERRTLDAEYTRVPNGDVPASVAAGLVVRIPVPCNVSATGLLHLINTRAFHSRAELVIGGFLHKFDDAERGVYSPGARAALDGMLEIAKLHFERAEYLVPVVSARDYIDRISLIIPAGSDAELNGWAKTYAALAWMTMGAIFETRYQAIDYLRSLQR